MTYGELFRQSEYEWGRYTFELADPALLRAQFDAYEREANRALEQEEVIPAYDLTLKCSHTFNMLDARGTISVTQRTGYIERVRTLAHHCALAFLRQREALGLSRYCGSK